MPLEIDTAKMIIVFLYDKCLAQRLLSFPLNLSNYKNCIFSTLLQPNIKFTQNANVLYFIKYAEVIDISLHMIQNGFLLN